MRICLGQPPVSTSPVHVDSYYVCDMVGFAMCGACEWRLSNAETSRACCCATKKRFQITPFCQRYSISFSSPLCVYYDGHHNHSTLRYDTLEASISLHLHLFYKEVSLARAIATATYPKQRSTSSASEFSSAIFRS
jgi:hypothetical protein